MKAIIRITKLNHCPCGSGNSFAACCEPFLTYQAKPKTPEELMRSRYSAFTLENIKYIRETMKGKALNRFQENQLIKKVSWLQLKVFSSQEEGGIGTVEFLATYLVNNRMKSIHEKSKFELSNGTWYYTDGEHFEVTPVHISQNMECPCGSKRKFKNCHGEAKKN